MHSDSSMARNSSLLTATGIAGPVLLRLSSERAHMFLLAHDITYGHAEKILLHRVRVVHRSRRIRLMSRSLRNANLASLTLLKSESYIATELRPCIRVALHPSHYAFTQLLPGQYAHLRAMSPRRLAAAALILAPLPAQARLRDRAGFSVRIAALRLGHLVRTSKRMLNAPLLSRS